MPTNRFADLDNSVYRTEQAIQHYNPRRSLKEAGAEAPAQLRDGGNTVSFVEVVIHQQAVRRYLGFCDDRDRRLEIWRLQYPAAPSGEQRFHSIENREVVVDAQHGDAGELHAIDLPGQALMLARGNGGGERHADRELRSTADRRGDGDPAVENACDALHDREAKPQAACRLGALIEPVEFLENRPLFRSRNAQSGIVDVDAQSSAAGPAAHKHAALGGVFDRVGDEIL